MSLGGSNIQLAGAEVNAVATQEYKLKYWDTLDSCGHGIAFRLLSRALVCCNGNKERKSGHGTKQGRYHQGFCSDCRDRRAIPVLILSLLQCALSSDYLAPGFNKGFESEFMDEMDQGLYPTVNQL